MQKTPGALPPDPRAFGRFSFRKTGIAVFLEPTSIQQGPEAPELEWAQGRKNAASPKPWAAALFIVDSGSRATAGFPPKKAGKPPGGPGAMPLARLFAFFLRAKKEGGPQARPEKDGYSGLSVHKEHSPSKRTSNARPPPFVPGDKRMQKRPQDPRTPGDPVGSLFRRTSPAELKTDVHTTRGPEAPELEWAQGRKNAASPKPRGCSPFYR